MTSRQSAPDARIRSFVERICRLKAEQDALQLDIQAVYLEAKKDNLDKTALGQVVSIVRKREKNREKFEESANVVEMYLAAVDGHGSHAYARVPQDPAPRQVEKFDAETGEVEPDESGEAVVVLDGQEIPLSAFASAVNARAERDHVVARPAPYRIDARTTAPKPPAEDLDLPAGLRREPVRSAAE